MSTPALEPGSFVGGYRIERELDRGGSAIVYLAQDRERLRAVALKVLLPDVASSVSVERFLREIRITARLVHPLIVSLHDSGIIAGLPYFVMPFVEGESLRALMLRERRLGLDDALRITREVADALDYAHAVGVVHRDIKPENILMSAGHAVVADFGIAKAFAAAAEIRTEDGAFRTGTDPIIGTAAYMSPEQAAGDADYDGRSDIYSLGTVLYEMLAGAPPFTAATPQAVILKRFVEDPVPLREHRDEVPEDVERAVARALAREPSARFPTAREFALALERTGTGGGTRAPLPAPEASIVVLPFENMSRDPDSEFFSDQMTDEIINALMRLRRLRVMARITSFALKGKHEDVREIGRRLNVRTVLEGSVRLADGRIRISAKLVNAADGYQLWFGEFDRDVGDAMALQDDLARSIAQTVQPSLLGTDPAARPRPNPAAYELYLRGRHFWNQRTPVSIARAQECFRQAIALDADFALAHAGEADLYTVLFVYGFTAPAEAMPKARDAARRAIALDPTAAEPHAALGTVHAVLEWDWKSASTEYRRALAINPQYATAAAWYANYVLIPFGRLDDALAELESARSYDPLSPHVNMSIGMALFYARKFGDAEAKLNSVLELNVNYPLTHYFLGRCLVESGRYAEGIESLRRALTISGGNPMATAEIGYAHALAGERASAESALNMLRAQSAQRYVSSCQVAQVHAALGNVDEAMRLFEIGCNERAPDVLWLGVHPGFDRLRADPRLQSILARVGLIAPR